MSSRSRRAACMVLAALGTLSWCAEAHAVPNVKGTVYESDGTVLKSTQVNITVKDSAGVVIGTAKSSGCPLPLTPWRDWRGQRCI